MKPLDAHRKLVANTRRASPAVSFGANFAAGMAFFSFIGWKLDQRRGVPDAYGFTLGGIMMGLLYGGYELWKIVRTGSADEQGGEKTSVGKGAE